MLSYIESDGVSHKYYASQVGMAGFYAEEMTIGPTYFLKSTFPNQSMFAGMAPKHFQDQNKVLGHTFHVALLFFDHQ